MRMEVFNEDYETALQKVLDARAGTVSSPSGTEVMEPGDLGNQIISRTGLAPRFTGDTPEYRPMRGEFISEAGLEQDIPGLARGELEGVQVPSRGEGR